MSSLWLDRLPRGTARLVAPGQPVWRPPMLATLHSGPLPRGEWHLERKFDGQRVAVIHDNDPRIVTRTGLDVTARYADVVASLPRGQVYVLDGELVAFADGRDDIATLHRRMNSPHVDLSVPVFFLAFDILHLDGMDLDALPLSDRRAILENFSLRGRAAVVPAVRGEPEQILPRACERGWEGLIAKRLEAPYENRRSEAWRKLMCRRSGIFLVGGHTPPGGTRAGFGALLLGEMTDDGLRYVGKVGSGFNAEALVAIATALQDLERATPPFLDAPPAAARWVEPVIACRVGYLERTAQGRLRHPRFMGLARQAHVLRAATG